MTSFISKFVAKRILGESLQNKFGTEDPYFEQVPATRLNGKPSKKMKKRRKALPPGISDHDGQILTKVKRRAYRLDLALFSLCGIRFGWSSVIGIIPMIGDALDAFMAMMVVKTCMQIEGGLPASLKTHMVFNVALDFVVGLVPFIGDVADALYRANTRNAIILEKHLREKGAKELKKRGQTATSIDPSVGEEYDRLGDEHFAGQETGTVVSEPRATETAQPAKESRGWFGRSKKAPPPDVEMGASGNPTAGARPA